MISKIHVPRPPFIKICGLTDPSNAVDCVRAGADAIGLVFFEKSPRNVSISQAAEITRALPPDQVFCGVFVDATFDFIMEVKQICGIKAAQLHGSESPELVQKLTGQGLIVIKALFAARNPLLTDAAKYPDASAFLVEYGKGILPGGNAETWDYSVSSGLKTDKPVILAGGLSSENVRQALDQARPWGLDVSSGVEKEPGIKDVQKVKDLIDIVKHT
ncbi:phosphoribosylanthranilate isomerase [Desulfospira joergensenii]|uniref:phosphoribosylanthranilate isomerase n=1 Tax=Desulfospira joergensenii TaxID=53329 RepID=UPI0003B78EF6|nr:phosphoribosylanthranilate isomerase [Desulfospira joergensenii]